MSNQCKLLRFTIYVFSVTHIFKWLLSCILCFTWESNSFCLGYTGPISYHWQKQRHKYSKYQGRYLKFPFLNSNDQNLIYPSLRLCRDGEIRTFFGHRDFLRVFQRFCAAVSVCVNMVPLRPPLLTTSSWAAATAGIFGGQLKERALWTESKWRVKSRAEHVQQDPSGHWIPCNDLKRPFP